MTRRTLTAAAAAIVVAFSALGVARAMDAQGEATVNAAANAGAPIFPGGTPINGGLQNVTQYSKVIGTNVTYSTTKAFDDVYKFYVSALPKNSETNAPQAGSTSRIATFHYAKADGSQIEIEIREYPGHTNYTITDTYKK